MREAMLTAAEGSTWAFGWEALVALGTLGLAAATVFAIFAAGPVRRHFGQARLTMELLPKPPDVHLIEMRHPETRQLSVASCTYGSE